MKKIDDIFADIFGEVKPDSDLGRFKQGAQEAVGVWYEECAELKQQIWDTFYCFPEAELMFPADAVEVQA